MTSDHLARLLRRAFFAGALITCALLVAWRVFDWPTWLGSAAAFVIGSTAVRATYRISARAAGDRQ